MSGFRPFYLKRSDDGTYDAILEQMITLDKSALANVTIGTDFVRSRDVKANHFEFVDTKENKPISVILFGEVCHSSSGTVLRASGNHYTGPKGVTPVTDSSTIKDTLVLKRPTAAPHKLCVFYDNQVAALDEIRQEDEKEEREQGKNPIIKEFLRPSTETPNECMDLIAVVMGKKYVNPDRPNFIKKTEDKKPKRLTRKKVTNNEENSDNETMHGSDCDDADDETNVVKIELGAFYPPDMLPDHRGPYFQQDKARLVQLDIEDVDSNLIPPWEMYDKLRPGTLVLVHATLVCWVIKDNDEREKKIYQVNAEKIRVLAESEEDIEDRPVPVLPDKPMSRFNQKRNVSPNANSSIAFENFQSPNKKNKFSS